MSLISISAAVNNMDLSVLCLLTLAIAFVPLHSAQLVDPNPKPGSCPRPDGFGICVHGCTTDQDCEEELKCCSNGCGTTCMEPRSETKPGICPRPIPHFAECDDECSNDCQCEKNLKCCYSGCGLACMEPVRDTKPGTCPNPVPHLVKCDDECFTDSECEMNLKCCYSGCGYKCLCPVY